MCSTESVLQSIEGHTLSVSDQNKPPKKVKPKSRIICSPPTVDFGSCFPGQIGERQVTVKTDPFKEQMAILHISCECMDEDLNQLPEYIFALGKQGSDQYSNWIRIKVQGQSLIKFNVGMKVPRVTGLVAGLIIVRVLGSALQPTKILVRTNAIVPRIMCLKQLSLEQTRSVRILIKQGQFARKEDRKISFKNPGTLQFMGQTEIVGLDDQHVVDCSPRNVMVSSESFFNLMVHIRPTEDIRQQIILSQSNYTLRRVLLIKVRDSSVIFHFPLEIIFWYSQLCDIPPPNC